MSKIKYFFNNFEFLLGGVFTVVMVAVLFLQVITRYVFHYSLAFAEELGVIMFIMTVYFGAIGATRRNQHLRIELLTNKLKPKAKLFVGIIANIVFIVANAFIIYSIITVTTNLFNYGMTTAILGIPKWICYTALPFSFLMITLRLIQDCFLKAVQIKNLGEGSEE